VLHLTETTPDDLVVTTQVSGDRALIHLAGELDAFTSPEVDDALMTLAADGVGHFTIDATDLTFVGSSGVAVIVRLLAAHPRSVVSLFGASTSYRRMLDVTGVAAHLALID